MRTILALSGLGLVACTGSELEFRSTLQTETDGLTLSEEGLRSYGAMVGTTCTIAPQWGCAIDDEDLPTDDEKVLDHHLGQTLAIHDTTLHFLDGGDWVVDSDVDLPDLRTARLADPGLVALRGSASACSLEVAGAAVAVPGALCAEDALIEVDRRGGLVAATSAGVYRADASGATHLGEGADRLAVDPILGQTYLAKAGERTLRAVADDGRVAWSAELPVPVGDLVVRGDKGDVMVLAEEPDGLGAVLRVDGSSGEVLSRSRIPSPNGELVVSGNGRTLAVVTEDAVHYFDVVVAGEYAPIDTVEFTCQDLPLRNSSGFAHE